MDLTVEGYFASRPDITPEMMEKARRLTEEKIRAYELKQARKACAMTQQEIAAKMGVSQKRVSDLENGNIGVVQVDTLRRYVAGLGGTLEINARLPQGTIPLACDTRLSRVRPRGGRGAASAPPPPGHRRCLGAAARPRPPMPPAPAPRCPATRARRYPAAPRIPVACGFLGKTGKAHQPDRRWGHLCYNDWPCGPIERRRKGTQAVCLRLAYGEKTR